MFRIATGIAVINGLAFLCLVDGTPWQQQLAFAAATAAFAALAYHFRPR